MRTLRYSVTGSTLGDFELTVAESSTLKHTPVRFDQIGADTQGIIGELGTPTYTQLSPTTRDALFAAAELVFSAITDLGETRTPSKGVAMLELSDADGYAREVSWGRWTIEEESPAFAPSEAFEQALQAACREESAQTCEAPAPPPNAREILAKALGMIFSLCRDGQLDAEEAAAMKALVIGYDERVLAICNSEADSQSTVVKRMLALLDEEAQSSLNTVERWDI